MIKKPNTTPLEGQRINKLSVMSRLPDRIRPNGKKRPLYLCECSCGNYCEVESQALRGGYKIDCGCGEKSRRRAAAEIEFGTAKKHWEASSSYDHMIGRCYDPKEPGYGNYGGRGIQVESSWASSFWNFLKDMGERPAGFVLDRIDPNGNYCKENCRWVDRNLSSFNTRKARNNTSGRTGVYWFKRVSKWTAAIIFENKQIHLGYFEDFDEAVKAREKAEIEYFGENKYE